MRSASRILKWVSWPLLGLLLFVLWPSRLGGDTTFVVVRGTSMEPKYHTGDLVIARTNDSYRVGDIVVFRVPSGAGKGELIVHRLIEIGEDGSMVTQGDNRTSPDSFSLHVTDIVGSPVVIVPMGGAILAMFATWWFLALAAGAFIFWRLWPDEVDEEVEKAVGHDVAEPADDLEWFTSVMGGDVLDSTCDFELWSGDLDAEAPLVNR